jgi:hypothetical protein
MKGIIILIFAAIAAYAVGLMSSAAGDAAAGRAAARSADDGGSPIFGVKIPVGYRQWELIAPSNEAGSLGELRGILGNAAAMKAYGEGKLPFPDGAMLAKLAWKHVPAVEDNAALGHFQAFVPGRATTVQFMLKDSKKYASTGGSGFGRFIGGKPVDEPQHKTCFPCHAAHAKGQDLVFTHYAP